MSEHAAIEITSIEHFSEICATAGDIPIIIDFTAKWCPPCQMIKPIYEQLAQDNKGKMIFIKVDVDDQGQIAEQFGIEAMPTFIVLKDGSAVETMRGANKAGLEALIGKHKKA